MFFIRAYEKKDPITRHLILALGLHTILYLVVWAIWTFDQTLENHPLLSRHRGKPDIMRYAVRVDVVTMPKLTIKELQKAHELPPPAPPKAAQEAPPRPNELTFKKVEKKKSLSEFLKEMSAKDIPKPKGTPDSRPRNEREWKKLEYLGNRIAKGQRAYGDTSAEQSETELASYAGQLPDLIRPYWRLPSYLKKQKLRCRAQVHISKTGHLLQAKVVETSGVPEYDDLALRALKSASPFPRPPGTIIGRVVDGDIVVGFPL